MLKVIIILLETSCIIMYIIIMKFLIVLPIAAKSSPHIWGVMRWRPSCRSYIVGPTLGGILISMGGIASITLTGAVLHLGGLGDQMSPWNPWWHDVNCTESIWIVDPVILMIIGVPKLEQTTSMKHVTIKQADGMIRGKGLGKSPRFFVITVRYTTLLVLYKIALVPFSRCPASVWRDSVWCRDNCCLYLSHVKTPEKESGLYWDCIYACAGEHRSGCRLSFQDKCQCQIDP